MLIERVFGGDDIRAETTRALVTPPAWTPAPNARRSKLDGNTVPKVAS